MTKKKLVLFMFWILVGANGILLMLGAGTPRMVTYYEDETHFVEIQANIISIDHDIELDKIFIELDISDNDQFDGYFVINGDNVDLVLDSNFIEESSSDMVTVTSAPGIFGDGYNPPIAGIKQGSNVYLDSDIGIDNIIEDAIRQRTHYYQMFMVSVPLLLVFSTWGFILSKHKKV